MDEWLTTQEVAAMLGIAETSVVVGRYRYDWEYKVVEDNGTRQHLYSRASIEDHIKRDKSHRLHYPEGYVGFKAACDFLNISENYAQKLVERDLLKASIYGVGHFRIIEIASLAVYAHKQRIGKRRLRLKMSQVALSVREKDYIERYFGLNKGANNEYLPNKTQSQIAAEDGISRTAVSTVCKRACKKLGIDSSNNDSAFIV